MVHWGICKWFAEKLGTTKFFFAPKFAASYFNSMKRAEQRDMNRVNTDSLTNRMGSLFLILTLLLVPMLNEIPSFHSHDETVACDGSHDHGVENHSEEDSEVLVDLNESIYSVCLFYSWNSNKNYSADIVPTLQLVSYVEKTLFCSFSETFKTECNSSTASRAPPFIV